MFYRTFTVCRLLGLCWLLATSLPAREIVTKVVDGLGRPVSGTEVVVNWLQKDASGEVHQVDLVRLTTGTNGVAKGSYAENVIPAGEDVWVNLDKAGYQGFSSSSIETEFVLKRSYTSNDLNRIAALPQTERTRELREFLAGECEECDFEGQVFQNEDRFRPALRELVTDDRVSRQAIPLLAFVGVPDDLKWIVRHAPQTQRELCEDRWAYEVASALVTPDTEMEWEFLRRCALNDYDDPWVDAGAIRTLRLIAVPQSERILEEVLLKNPDRANSVTNALAYIRSHPAALSNTNLVVLGERLARVITTGHWEGNDAPRYNKAGDKACISCRFIAGQDLLVHTATFHREGEVWKFRGVRETLQALLATPLKPDQTP